MKKLFIFLFFSCAFNNLIAQNGSVLIQPSNDEVLATKHGGSEPNLAGRYARGTAAAPTATISGDPLTSFSGRGHTGIGFTGDRAKITMVADETFTSTANGTRMTFLTTTNGTTSAIERMRIDNTGFVGIGATNPLRRLHVSDGSSGVTPNGFAAAFFEGSSSSYIQLASPETSAVGVLFGKPSSNLSGSILYDSGNNISLRTGGNLSRVTITNAGNVGIGTTAPTAKLHVTGAVTTEGDVQVNASFPFITLNTNGTGQNAGVALRQQGTAKGWVFYENSSSNLKINASSTGVGAGGINIKSSGFVGIGTETPTRSLEVSDSGSPFIRISDISGGSDVGLEFFRTGAGFIDWRVRDSGGDLDFLASSDDFATTVNEYQMTTTSFSPGVTNVNSLGNSSFRWTAVHATNGTIQTSDRREKENIKALNYGLKDILNMSPVRYTWKSNPEQGQKVGLIAQDVATIIPEVVTGLEADGKVGEGRLGMNYAELVPVLINAIKEQQQMIDKLTANVNTLNNELASAKKQFETQKELKTDK